jgi:spore coat polysaccharide biosynthesis protein SpsF (cytidylyltransferase family)
VFGADTLETAWREATDPAQREHVTSYMKVAEEIETQNVQNVLDTSAYEFLDEDTIPRWTVDYPEDMEFVREIYSRLIGENYWVFDQQSVLELLERAPELREINEDR